MSSGGTRSIETELSIESSEFRRVLGTFMTGVTVMTTRDPSGVAHGLTVNSFSSVSLDPPLVLWSQSRTAPSHGAFTESGRFAVNILAEHQWALSQHFARPATDKFAGVAVREGLAGMPLIEGCAAYLECVVEDRFPGGDHQIFLGRVVRMSRQDQAPLLFGLGRYHRAHPLLNPLD